MPKPNTHIFEFDAIGTHWWCEDLSGTPLEAKLQRAILDYADQFDQAYSRFIPSSFVDQLNHGHQIDHPPQELLDMLTFAREMYDASDGAFNISIGGSLHAAGYGSRDLAAHVWPDIWKHLRYSSQCVSVPPGMTLDFGGFGKGWMIDHIAALMTQHGVAHYIVNGGGDLRVNAPVSLRFALEDPSGGDTLRGYVQLQRGALAVSANTKRSWQHDGTTYYHIMSPTGEKLRARGAYVLGSSALITDTLATIALLRPDLTSILEQRYNVQIQLA